MTLIPTIHVVTGFEDRRWGTLSGLAAHPTDPALLYAVTDYDSPPPRIMILNVGAQPVVVSSEIVVRGSNATALDLEGIAAAADGTFWLASERIPVSEDASQAEPDFILHVASDGNVIETFGLPSSISARMDDKGLEGITLAGPAGAEIVVVVLQAGITGDPAHHTRIGTLDPRTGAWAFFFYPLEPSPDQKGLRVGLSEVLHLDGMRFGVIERDGRKDDGAFKWLCSFDLAGLTGASADGAPPVLTKTRHVDLAALFVAAGRKVEQEIEGLAATTDGVYVLTDNDNKRDTLLIRLGDKAAVFPKG